MTPRHRSPDAPRHRSPDAPRRRILPAVIAGAVIVVAAALLAMHYGDAISVRPTAQPTPPTSRQATTPTPAPWLPTDLPAPDYPYGTETATSPLRADLRPSERVTVYRDRPGPVVTRTAAPTTQTVTATTTVTETATTTVTTTATVTAVPELTEEEMP